MQRGILVRQQRRGWLVPEVSLQAQYGDPIDYSWDDSVPSNVRDEDDRWQVGLVAELRILEGGAKFAELARRRASERSIMQQYSSARDNVDRGLSDAFDAAAADFPNRELQKVAAERSAENLDVLQTKYSRGTSTLTELLDAQNQAVQASLSSAQATYQYLGTIVNLQRQLTWFENVADENQRANFIAELQSFEPEGTEEPAQKPKLHKQEIYLPERTHHVCQKSCSSYRWRSCAMSVIRCWWFDRTLHRVVSRS